MSLPLAEKTWMILPEAPEDDNTPTGNYFAILHNVIDFDFDGAPSREIMFLNHILSNL